MRTATVERITGETKIKLTLNLAQKLLQARSF